VELLDSKLVEINQINAASKAALLETFELLRAVDLMLEDPCLFRARPLPEGQLGRQSCGLQEAL
jgi:hypothetical protein